MRIARSILFAILAFSATAASAQAIDCVKLDSRLDSVICADAEMRDYQSRIAAAFGKASAVWDGAIASYVRLEQQEWLLSFRTIETMEAAIDDDCLLTDRGCISEQMRRRVETMESGAYIHSGVYRAANGMKLLLHPGLATSYRVRVFDPARLAKADLLTLEATQSANWDGPLTMISTMGDANGRPLPTGDGCTLRLTPRPMSIDISQTGACKGISYEGNYSRLLGETLRKYDLELH